MKAMKTTLVSILSDQSQNFNFLKSGGANAANKAQRFTKASVRVKAVFNALVANTTPGEIPEPLLAFCHSFAHKGAFMPNNFLTQFELDRLKINNRFGTLDECTLSTRGLLIGMFIIGKILIVKIFLNPSEVSPGIKISDQSLKNFKIVASLVHHIFLLYIKI